MERIKMIFVHQIRSIVVVSVFAAGLAFNFSSGTWVTKPVYASGVIEPIVIEDNLGEQTSIKSVHGLAILNTLRQFEQAYESGSQEHMGKVLAQDFTFMRVLDEETNELIDRNPFLSMIGGPINISLSHIKPMPSFGALAAVASVGIYSEYFAENEVYTFLFHPEDPRKILHIIAVPVYSEPYPEGGAMILIVPTPGGKSVVGSSWAQEASSVVTATEVIQSLQEQDVSAIKGDETIYAAIAIFREPLMPGTRIIFEHHYFVKGKWLFPASHRYKVSQLGRFHIIESGFQIDASSGAKIAFRIFVDKNLVAEDVRPVR